MDYVLTVSDLVAALAAGSLVGAVVAITRW